VEGQTHFLARGKAVRLTLARQFVWKVDDREPQIERLPNSVPGMELVIRR
jgi:hypothetical protein